MTQLKALGMLALAATLILGLGAGAASALKVGGLAGKPASPSDDACADYSYGGLGNSCTTTKTFLVPLSFETAGYKTISYRAKGATSTNNVGCRGTAMNDNHTAYAATPTVYLSQFGNAQDVSLGDLSVGGSGAVYLNCSIDAGGKLLLVEWEQ